ncbi:MAG: phosphoglycerate kinase [Phycisphaerales bacterium]|nr:phosphoglycerate kinase [Phycisphaerales bacterium]
MAKTSVRDLDVAGKRVLIRADLNVPFDANGRISDDRRITQFLPTLQNVIDRGGAAILMSHLGRPTGDPAKDASLSLKPVAERIGELTGKKCGFVTNCIGPEVEKAAHDLKKCQTLLLENLRFHKAETIIDKAKKNPDGKLTPDQEAQRQNFAKSLAGLGDLYVNDAFGACHRMHVSMYDVPALLGPGRRAIGFLVEKELKYLRDALEHPQRPFVAVLGGAKVSDKIGVIRNLIPRVDQILIGGAMTYTFWAAKGWAIGRSLCEQDKVDLARELIAEAGDKLVLPMDSIATEELYAGASPKTVRGELPPDLMGVDIGPDSVAHFVGILKKARTIIWNGPVGAFEYAPFDAGTNAIAKAIAEATDAGATSVIGGGDSAAAVEKAHLSERMTHISTGGGASLSFLEGEAFETIDIIDDK